MVTLGLIMGMIGAMVALLIGILIFSEVESAIDCESVFSEQAKLSCNSAKETAWVVIGILPIALFFALFSIFGGIGGGRLEDDDVPTQRTYEKSETKKERQKRKQAEVDRQLEQYDDKVVHSFLTNWFRKKKE